MKLSTAIPEDWKELLKAEVESDWFAELQEFLDEEWRNETGLSAAGKDFQCSELDPG